jgi:hypothetical protein
MVHIISRQVRTSSTFTRYLRLQAPELFRHIDHLHLTLLYRRWRPLRVVQDLRGQDKRGDAAACGELILLFVLKIIILATVNVFYALNRDYRKKE